VTFELPPSLLQLLLLRQVKLQQLQPSISVFRQRTDKPSRSINNHSGQLSLPSLWGRKIEYRPAWLGL